MKAKKFKTIAVATVLALAVALVSALGGCRGEDGRDGVNGKDLTIYDIWQETVARTENPDLTYEEFLREYLSFTSTELEEMTSLQAAVNRSLLSGVSIISTFREYGSSGRSSLVSYYGSGVILDVDRESGDMTVVTNSHVVYSVDAKQYSNGKVIDEGYADLVQLWFYGSEYDEDSAVEATVYAASKTYDVAVLKVEGSELVKNSQAVAAAWYGGEECYLGETVYAVGNADGKKLSASAGIISKDSEDITVNLGTDTSPEAYTFRVLRTDAAVNGGNSGGGLYNKCGELVGIVNAKAVSNEVDNMNYALPAATTKRVVNSLLSRASGSYGIDIVASGITCVATDSYTTGLNSQGLAEIKEVVAIASVELFSKVSGKLKTGDVITGVTVTRNGATVEDMTVNRLHNLADALLSVRAGDAVAYSIVRNGLPLTVSVVYTSGDFSHFE